MNFVKRMLEGVWAINVGLKTPFERPYRLLFIYPIIAQLFTIGLIALIIALQGQYNFALLSDIVRVGIQHTSNNFSAKKIVLFCTTIFEVFMLVALVFHFIHIWYKQWSQRTVTVAMSMRFAFSKIVPILAFGLITAGLRIVWVFYPLSTTNCTSIILWFLVTGLFVIWSLLLILIVPVIALEDTTDIRTIWYTSATIARSLAPQFLGGLLWFLIIIVAINSAINILPPLLLPSTPLVSFSLYLLGSLTTAYLTLCHTIFGTLLYLGFKDEVFMP